MKTCKDCGVHKPLTDYYAHSAMSDGHLSSCKECVKSRVKLHREKNIERVRKYDRNRPNHKERVQKTLERERQKKKDPEYRAKIAAQKREWQRKNAEKRAAHVLLNNAVRDGRVKKLPCVVCGSELSEGHHEDYTKPLEVVWLCRKHHAEAHKTDK